MRRLLVAGAVALASLSIAPAALALPSGPTGEPFDHDSLRYCPTGTTVVDVTHDVTNDTDVGTAGNTWADLRYTHRLIVIRIDAKSFCAVAMYGGKFDTRAGTSPGGTGFVPAGLGGQFAGNYRTTVFRARWQPLVPTSGWLGVFDSALDWKSLYFTSVRDFAVARYSFQYASLENGTWTNRAPEGNSGDIKG